VLPEEYLWGGFGGIFLGFPSVCDPCAKFEISGVL